MIIMMIMMMMIKYELPRAILGGFWHISRIHSGRASLLVITDQVPLQSEHLFHTQDFIGSGTSHTESHLMFQTLC